jgi:hypothetical protein
MKTNYKKIDAIIILAITACIIFLGMAAFLGITEGAGYTVEDIRNSTINRSVVVGSSSSYANSTRYSGVKSNPVSRGIRPHDVIERRRGSVCTIIVNERFKYSKKPR